MPMPQHVAIAVEQKHADGGMQKSLRNRKG
jgi:hypothetical protein